MVTEDDLGEGPFQVLGEEFGDAVEVLGVDRVGVVPVAAHAGPLGALPGEEVGEGAVGGGAGDQQAGCLVAPGQGVQRFGGPRPVGGQDDGAVRMGGAGGGERQAEVRGRCAGQVPQPGGLAAQCLG